MASLPIVMATTGLRGNDVTTVTGIPPEKLSIRQQVLKTTTNEG